MLDHRATGHGAHGAHGHGSGHGDHAAIFRQRFWWSLALTLPLVVLSPMVQEWFGYHLEVRGQSLLVPLLGSAVFLYGGWPFLTGGLEEARSRRPGMMLLIAMAIVVAYGASLATTFELLDMEFWWELGALI